MFQVVGLDSVSSANPDRIEAMIRSHCIGLRDHPRYKNAFVVFYIEANLSHIEANRMSNTIRSIRNFSHRAIIMRRDPKDLERVGVLTTHSSKERWVNQMRASIGSMRFAEDRDFVTARTPDEMRNRFCEQLTNFRKDIKHTGKSPEEWNKLPSYNYTGKSAGKTDDLFSVVAIALIHSTLDVFQSPDRLLMHKARNNGMSLAVGG